MGSVEERVARAQARVERELAESWKPRDKAARHPDAIAGEVVESSVRVGAGRNGEDVKVLTVREPAGREWAVHCYGRILTEELAWAPLGSVVAVKYEGLRQGRTEEYQSYRVVVDPPPTAVAAAPATAPATHPPEEEFVPVEPAPEPDLTQVCSACGGDGRHLPGCPARASEVCGECGFLGGHHRDGCANDIPF